MSERESTMGTEKERLEKDIQTIKIEGVSEKLFFEISLNFDFVSCYLNLIEKSVCFSFWPLIK